jgi:hypothetical protein
MEKTIDITEIQAKLSRIRKSCSTPEHYTSLRRYRELYEERLKRYSEDFNYRLRVDFMLLMVVSFFSASIVGAAVFGLLMKIFSH